MNKAMAKRWVKALRSGKYKQGTGNLCGTNDDGELGFCCLGVLIDTEVDTYWVRDPNYSIQEVWGVATDSGGISSGLLPPEIVKSLGLRSNNGSLSGGDLATKNDSGYSFEAIADIIEEHYAEL